MNANFPDNRSVGFFGAPTTRIRVVGIAVAAVAIVTPALPGCGILPSREHRSPHAAAEDRSVQHRWEPLAKHFPSAGNPITVSWVKVGSCDGDRIPGPCDYWLDAIIEIQPALAAALRTKHIANLHPTDRPGPPDLEDYLDDPDPGKPPYPDVMAELKPFLPPGPYVTSESLDKAFSTYWPTRAYLHHTRPILVMDSTDSQSY